MNWNDAKSYSAEKGWNLASIHSIEEWDFLKAKIIDLSHDYIWVGGKKIGDDWTWDDKSQFQWTDNSTCTFDCKGIWANEEPTRGARDVCTYLKKDGHQTHNNTSYKMRDASCSKFVLPFIVTVNGAGMV